jgi:acetyl esterase/lipase
LIAASLRDAPRGWTVFLLRFLTALVQLFGAGRSPAVFLNLLAPRGGYRLHRDIPYGSGPRHRMDIYVPDAVRGPAPVVLFFYGGAFMAGRKSEYRIVGQALASQGIVVAVADYRILPDARFPDFLEDGAKAFAALKGIAKNYGGDTERVFVMGHSAGAYIAVMLAADPRWLKAEGLEPPMLKGAIGIASSYGSFATGSAPNRVFAGRTPQETQPVHLIDGKRPPMLLLSGGKDYVASIESARAIASKLRAAGSAVEEIVYPEAGHMGIILSLAPRYRHIAGLRDDIARFVTT